MITSVFLPVDSNGNVVDQEVVYLYTDILPVGVSPVNVKRYNIKKREHEDDIVRLVLQQSGNWTGSDDRTYIRVGKPFSIPMEAGENGEQFWHNAVVNTVNATVLGNMISGFKT